MHDLMEMELNGFAGARQMARRVSALRPRPRPPVTARTAQRTPLARPMTAHKAAPARAVRARAIIAAQLSRTLGPALSGVIAAAARRKLAAGHGEQIEMPDIARRLREISSKLYMALISPAVIAAANAFASNPTTITSALLKGAVTFGAEKLKERGVLNGTETEAIKQLAPKAIEKAIPAIVDQLSKLGDGEGDMLAELESRW